MIDFPYLSALLAGWVRPIAHGDPISSAIPASRTPLGVSVVIPSRSGKALLRPCLEGVVRDLEGVDGEIIVIDNGSDDGTADWLRTEYPHVRVAISSEPLSFARAVNGGIGAARYSHVCLLNNDMRIEPGFFAALGAAFDEVPDLFCATAQIRFPEGVRREETGKAVMAQSTPKSFPIRCDEPLPGEDGTYVLYGSGGCSAYDAAKLRALGGLDEVYEPAYVEDLDVGYRAWQRGWPSVYVAAAVVEHRHRATTSRYYSEVELERVLEINYLRFLARAVADPKLFRRLWRQALRRLKLLAPERPAAGAALNSAAAIARDGSPSVACTHAERDFLALTDGSVSVFRGRPAGGRPRIVIASPGIAYGKRGELDGRAQVLVAFAGKFETPPPDVLEVYSEVVLVQRDGTKARSSARFRAALRQTVHKWRPVEARLESQAMEEYTPECGPARIILAR
jgi:GT2 family glycosyltransferase